jgi:hypothetical protein
MTAMHPPVGTWRATTATVGEVVLTGASLTVHGITSPATSADPRELEATLTGICVPGALDSGDEQFCNVIANGLRWTFLGIRQPANGGTAGGGGRWNPVAMKPRRDDRDGGTPRCAAVGDGAV